MKSYEIHVFPPRVFLLLQAHGIGMFRLQILLGNTGAVETMPGMKPSVSSQLTAEKKNR